MQQVRSVAVQRSQSLFEIRRAEIQVRGAGDSLGLVLCRRADVQNHHFSFGYKFGGLLWVGMHDDRGRTRWCVSRWAWRGRFRGAARETKETRGKQQAAPDRLYAV